MPIVNGLEKAYGDRMKFAVQNYQEGDAPQMIELYGLEVHGMVLTDQDGAEVWKESGHKQTSEGIAAALDKALSG